MPQDIHDDTGMRDFAELVCFKAMAWPGDTHMPASQRQVAIAKLTSQGRLPARTICGRSGSS
jgi:hypothetical protein